MFCICLLLGIAIDRIGTSSNVWPKKESRDQALLLLDLSNPVDISSDDLLNKWLNVEGELRDIQIDNDGLIVFKINSPIQSNGLKCFFSENIKSQDLDQLFSNQKIKLKGLCRRVGNNLVLVDCELI